MKSIHFTLPVIALLLGLLAGAYYFSHNFALGGVGYGEEFSLATVPSVGTSTPKTQAFTIGSIIVESPSAAGEVFFYATTTSSVTATSSGDLILSFDATAAEGTYEFNTAFAHGLLVETRGGYNGDIVITYR